MNRSALHESFSQAWIARINAYKKKEHLMNGGQYVGLDAHRATMSVAALDSAGLRQKHSRAPKVRPPRRDHYAHR